MAGPDTSYEAYALRFATTTLQKAGRYHRYASYGEPDADVPLDFYFWLVRNEDRVVLVDTGFGHERGAVLGYHHDVPPLDLLARFGVRGEDVDHVVLTHMHFDHIGNVGLFPNATFSISGAEYDFWTGPFADRDHLRIATEPDEVASVAALHEAGRLTFVPDRLELFPGLVATTVRGHTAGQMIVEVATDSGRVVLASDAIHFYEEMDLDRPFWLFCDLEGMYRGYDLLRRLRSEPGTVVVAGHDRAVMTMFEEVDADCVDLTRPIG
jgi:glyoxylase-like metal-dependent hydrolase (beta-lactamase superfamily II)